MFKMHNNTQTFSFKIFAFYLISFCGTFIFILRLKTKGKLSINLSSKKFNFINFKIHHLSNKNFLLSKCSQIIEIMP